MSTDDISLEIAGVSKFYGGVTALGDVTMSVDGRGITALIGPNGAGKTTLFNVISGFGGGYEGSISFDGTELTRLKPHQVARTGVVRTFQTPVGFRTLTVAENLMIALTGDRLDKPWAPFLHWREDRRRMLAARREADALLDQSGIGRLRDAFMADLSPGDLKLIEIVRQLALKPRMLLLDEPAAAMAVDQIATLSQLIKGIVANGVGVLVIDHNLGFVLELADRVHVLESGRVIASGTPDEIGADAKVREIYLGSEESADVA